MPETWYAVVVDGVVAWVESLFDVACLKGQGGATGGLPGSGTSCYPGRG